MTRTCAAALLCLFTLGACQREQRDFRVDPPVSAALDRIRLMPNGIGGAPPEIDEVLGRPYATNAYEIAQGKRLFTDFNCASCHASGGGGAAGPALIDGWWAYGPDLTSIYASIRDGRPKGMPAFRDHLTNEQIWQLAGYVQKIGSYSLSAASPGRNDTLQAGPAENRAPAGAPSARQPSRQ